MSMNNTLIAITILFTLATIFSKKIRTSRTWLATVTPLASIIGSGFLIIAPLLAMTAGRYSLVAISGLVLVGYACGEALRYNITYLEPLLRQCHSPLIQKTEYLSHVVLGVAYVISITFYLKLLAAFVLKGFEINNQIYANIITTVILIVIGAAGKFGGINRMESLEKYSVGVKIAIIAGLLVGLSYFNIELFFENRWALRIPPVDFSLQSLRILMGSLIVVQGFETSRFLGSKYSAPERVRTMRYAQISSSIIYLVFTAMIAVTFTETIHTSDTEIIELTKKVASILPVILVVAAAMSQFSAAVADTTGSGGLLYETFKPKLSLGNSYVIIGCMAIILTWAANIFLIVSLASRAFALFYSIQASEASAIALTKHRARSLFFLVLSLCLLGTAIFGLDAGI